MPDNLLTAAYQKLFEALTRGGLAGICRTASELLDRPVVFVNAELRKLAQYPDQALGHKIWDCFYEKGELTSELIWQLYDQGLLGRAEAGDSPYWANWGLYEERPNLICSVKIDDKIEGYISVSFAQKEYCYLHIQILELVAQAVKLEMMKQTHSRGTDYPVLISSFIRDLLGGSIRTLDVLANWEKRLAKSFVSPFCVAVVSDEGSGSLLHYAQSIIVDRDDCYNAVLDHKLYILFTQYDHHDGPFKTLEIRQNVLHNLLSDSSLALGISNQFNSLLHMDIFKYQAERALMLGRRHYPKLNVHWYTELILENMISHVRENLKSFNYMHPMLELLYNYDRQNNTEYVQTLKVYITSMCSTSKTVKRMHIHRNTLLYRLKKIEELTNSSLEDERIAAVLLNNFYLLEDINRI